MTKRLTLAFAFVLALAVPPPAFAQSLAAAPCDTLKQLGAKFGALNKGTDDERRQFALIVAEQFAFAFPGEGWGSKAAGPGRPQSKDVVARQTLIGLDGWDLVDGTTRAVRCDVHVDLPGQLFIAVTPSDHLGGGGPIDPPIDDAVTHAELKIAIADLHTALWNELASELGSVRARLEKLEAGGGGGTGGGPSNDVALQQLAVSKEILDLLKKTAARFGVQ